MTNIREIRAGVTEETIVIQPAEIDIFHAVVLGDIDSFSGVKNDTGCSSRADLVTATKLFQYVRNIRDQSNS